MAEAGAFSLVAILGGIVILVLLVFATLWIIKSGRRNPVALGVVVILGVLLVSLGVVAGPKIIERMQYDPAILNRLPFKDPSLVKRTITAPVAVDGEVEQRKCFSTEATLSAYDVGSCAVIEIADVRIAFQGESFGGDNSRGTVIATDLPPNLQNSGSGSMGMGQPTLRYSYGDASLRFSYLDYDFTVKNGVLDLDGKKITLGEGRRIFLLEERAPDFIELTPLMVNR